MSIDLNYFSFDDFLFPNPQGTGVVQHGNRRLEYDQAEIVQQLLVDHGIGTLGWDGTRGVWPIFASVEPDAPDNIVVVYGTVGVADGRTRTGEIQGPDGFQIKVRSSNYRVGQSKMNQILLELTQNVSMETVHVAANSDVGTIDYLVYSCGNFGGVLSIGQDTPGSKRSSFTLNATITARKITS